MGGPKGWWNAAGVTTVFELTEPWMKPGDKGSSVDKAMLRNGLIIDH